jgi:hypothetical protein
MPTAFDPPLEISLGNNPGVVRFKTSEEAINWIQREWGFWQALRNLGSPTDQWLDSMWGHESTYFNNLISETDAWHKQSLPRQHWEVTLSGKLAPYNSLQRIHSESLRGKFVQNLGMPLLAFRVALLLGVPKNLPLPFNGLCIFELWSRAAFIADCFERGWTDVAPSVERAFADVLSKWEKRLGEISKAQERAVEQLKVRDREQGERIASLASLVDQHRELLTKHQSEVATTLEESKASIAKHIDGVRLEIDAYKAQVKNEIAFKAPITYWEAKRDKHRDRARTAFIWFIIILIVGAGSLLVGAFMGVQYLFEHEKEFKYEMLAFLAIGAFPIVWVLRILSRHHLGNVALEDDAGDRIAMAQTFLALMEDPDKVKEADRILILSALFRPSTKSDSDDATPPNIADALMQRVVPKARE